MEALKTDKKLWEVLVPTLHGDTNKPVSTRFHKVWDANVQKITGGLTIQPPIKGIWVSPDKVEFKERMIPVRIACTEEQIQEIAQMTMKHYKQLAVMFYLLTDTVFIVHAKN